MGWNPFQGVLNSVLSCGHKLSLVLGLFFMIVWPSFTPKLINEASALVTTPYLEQLLQSAKKGARGDHLKIALKLALRKRTNKISACQAVDHLIDFHKSCRSLKEHLDTDEHQQPYLLA
ncbi:uncharacterized protein LOC107708692 [Tachysurus ichikawai]